MLTTHAGLIWPVVCIVQRWLCRGRHGMMRPSACSISGLIAVACDDATSLSLHEHDATNCRLQEEARRDQAQRMQHASVHGEPAQQSQPGSSDGGEPGSHGAAWDPSSQYHVPQQSTSTRTSPASAREQQQQLPSPSSVNAAAQRQDSSAAGQGARDRLEQTQNQRPPFE